MSKFDPSITESLNWALSMLSQHAYKLMAEMKNLRSQWCPEGQIRLRKTLVERLPDEPMDMDRYMDTIRYYIGKYDIQLSLVEYEAWLRRMGFVDRLNTVSKNHNIETWKQILKIFP